jgi:alanyl-tRNA synthetase
VTERLHLRDSYALEFEARVLSCRDHDGRPAAILDRTAFYAESGGQPWDTGTLDDARVIGVVEEGDDVLHILDRPLPEGPVRGRVDGERRRDHREQHHGQHLLSQAFVEVAEARTIGFHLGAETTTIDLDRTVTAEQIQAAETRANEVVWEARPVRVRTVPAEEARSLGTVPPAGVDAVRLVEAEGFDLQPCGGTHPRTTAEVGIVMVDASERYKGGTRVSFVCGHRALAASSLRRKTLGQLVAVLSAPLGELPEVAQKTKDDLAESERQRRGLLERALEGEARRLLDEARGTTAPPPSEPPVIVAAYEDRSPGELRVLAQRLVELTPCVAVLGSRSEKTHVVVAQSDGLPHDVPALLRSAVEPLGGRGGGRGNLAQGGGEHPELLDEALARVADAVRARK